MKIVTSNVGKFHIFKWRDEKNSFSVFKLEYTHYTVLDIWYFLTRIENCNNKSGAQLKWVWMKFVFGKWPFLSKYLILVFLLFSCFFSFFVVVAVLLFLLCFHLLWFYHQLLSSYLFAFLFVPLQLLLLLFFLLLLFN